MKTYIAKSDAEAQALRGTIALLVIPIEPQPVLPRGFTLEVPGPMSTRAIPVCWDCKAAGVPNDTPYPQLWLTEQAIPLPYAPGDVIAVQKGMGDGITTIEVARLLCDSVDCRRIEGKWCFVVKAKQEGA